MADFLRIRKQLRSDAPSVYHTFIARRKTFIDKRLNHLSFMLSLPDTLPNEKTNIEVEIKDLENELADIASGDLEIPTPTARKTV